MPALGRLDVIAMVGAQKVRNPKSGAGSDDADGTRCAQRLVGTAQMREMGWFCLRNGMAHRFEIIDERKGFDLQLLTDQRGTDDPGIVGELDHLAAHRTSDGDRHSIGDRTVKRFTIGLPRRLERRMFGSFHGHGLAKRNNPAIRHFSQRKTGVRAANIDRDNLHHRPASASIAEPPFSASSAKWRITANSSRAQPGSNGGCFASSRAAHSAGSTKASRLP